MSNNQSWHSIGSSVAAGVITYFILEWADKDWSPYWKMACIALAGIAAFSIALLTGRSRKDKTAIDSGRVKVGTQIKSKEGVEVIDVAVSDAAKTYVDIGKDIDAEKNVKITGIRVGPKDQ